MKKNNFSGIDLLSSIFIGSVIARILSEFIIKLTGLNFFMRGLNSKIPSFEADLANLKTYDITDFLLTIIFVIIFFGINRFILKKTHFLTGISLLITSFIIFLETHFVTHSGKSTLIIIAFLYIFLYIFSRKTYDNQSDKYTFEEKFTVILNGALSGFYLMLLANYFFTSVAAPLCILVLTPIVYFAFTNKYYKYFISHIHLLLVLSILNPLNLNYLLVIGVVISVLIIKLNNNFNRVNIYKLVYPVIFLGLLLYNPFYFVGNFDSVEEGFWLGWIERLALEQTLYKDVYVYHPPLIVWSMFLFEKFTGFTIANTRLFLHLLQITGIIIYFYLSKSILSSKINRAVVTLLAIALTATMVKNNVEIRLGVGLLAILFMSGYYLKKEKKYLILSGITSAISFFVSVEAGIAVITACTISVFMFSNKRIKSAAIFLIGVFAGAVPVLTLLFFQGALLGFFEQIFYYTKAFSEGYFNTPLDRAISLSYLHWHIFYQYLASNAWFWELARGGLIASLLFAVIQIRNGELDHKNKTVITLSIFGLILFRSALGRSDYYHLLFPLLISIPLIFFAIEKLAEEYAKPILNYALIALFLFVFSFNAVNLGFMSNLIFKFETYGELTGKPQRYGGERGKVLVGEEIDTLVVENLITYIKSETSVEDEIFVYPWSPELYFLTDRKNSTKIDTPYAFFTEKYQVEVIASLKNNPPKFVIYNPEMKFGGMVPDSLPKVDKYIKENFEVIEKFGNNEVRKSVVMIFSK